MNFNDFAYYGFKVVEKSVSLMPKKFLVNILGNLGFLLDKKRKNDICVNLNLAFPEKSDKEKKEIAKKVYKNFARNLIDFIENKKLSKEKLLEKVEFKGFEKLNYPVVFVTAHFGNWEILPLALGSYGLTLNAVYRKIDNSKLNKEIVENRAKFGVYLIEKKGALKKLIHAIKKNENVGLLVDQNTSRNDGIETTFFDKKVVQTSSAAILSKKFNIPIAMAFVFPKNDKWEITIKDIFYTNDIQKSVDRQSKVIEEVVREYPEEYYWFHRKFKAFYKEKYNEPCNF